jgi:Domain of unknown function(DUF2779)
VNWSTNLNTPTMTIPSISKSRYISGLQCDLLLWTHFNDRPAIPPPDAATQWIFDNGHRVGDLAKRVWPGGEEVPLSRDLCKTAAWTRELMRRRVPIFEASFLVDGRYCRVDILEPTGANAWKLIEVKSSTSVKEVNLHDVAFQADTLERAGVTLGRLELMNINRDYVLRGDLDPHGFFHREDITSRVGALGANVPTQVQQMHAVITGDRPTVAIGSHCDSPYSCDLKYQCWAGITEQVNVGRAPTERQIRPAALATWLEGLVYPVHHLDFETMNPAVPRFQGTRPYQRIPFQFSLHIQAEPDGPCEHHEFLCTDPIDPRPTLLEALQAIGPHGTVLAYNASFEKGVLNELGRDFPHALAMTNDLVARMEDLFAPFRSFDIYDPAQHGSASLKSVLPVWTELSYADLQVSDGQQAAREYERVVFGDTQPLARERLDRALREYCKQDTWAMVELLRVVREMAAG